MTPLVVDASAVLAWLLGDEPMLSARLEETLTAPDRPELLAPVLLRSEVANALAVALRRQRVSAAQVSQASALADALPISYEPMSQTIAELLKVAQHHNLSAYDGQYLELAMRRGARLMSADRALIAAAGAAGVAI